MKISFGELKDIISEEIILSEKREDRINQLESYVDQGYFVHFFELPKDQGHKFGINPKSEYNTPLGIYGYPLTYKIYEQILDGTLPFALERLYLHIFKPKESANILNLENPNPDYFAPYTKQLKKLYPKQFEKINFDNAKVQTPGGYFWYLTYYLQTGTFDWNKIFRRLGIDGVVDNGEGIIYSDEPYQCVFFAKSVIDHVDTIENPSKYSERYKEKHFFNNAHKYLINKVHKIDIKELQLQNSFLKQELKDMKYLNVKVKKIYKDEFEIASGFDMNVYTPDGKLLSKDDMNRLYTYNYKTNAWSGGTKITGPKTALEIKISGWLFELLDDPMED